MENKCLKRAFWCLAVITLSSCGQKPTKKPKNTSQDQSLVNGQLLYNRYCIACHQADGGGVPNINPPLVGTDYITGEKSRLIKILLNGMNEPVEINGRVYSNRMPSFSYLSDREIADILNLVRTGFGNSNSFINVSEVDSIRKVKHHEKQKN